MFFLMLIESSDLWLKTNARPMLFFMAIYIAVVYKLNLINLYLLAAFGFLQDGYYNLPLGYTSCLYLTLYLILQSKKTSTINENIYFGWLIFGIYIAFACFLKTASLFLIDYWPADIKAIIKDAALTLAVFPAITMLLVNSEKYLGNY